MIMKTDIDSLKNSVDVSALAGTIVNLQRASAKEQKGPCPKCGGDDRFHCQREWFFCRKCHPQRGDVFEFVGWYLGLGFQDAYDHVRMQVDLPSASVQIATRISNATSRWDTPDWQADAQKLVARAEKQLFLPQGAIGLEYLGHRGFTEETCRVWHLGFDPNYQRSYSQDGKWVKENLGPAITLPWMEGHSVRAVQYRFINKSKYRYWQKSGGDRTVFGLPLLGDRETLVICEGELNAISIWQAAHDLVDVVSFGSESNLEHASQDLASLSERYEKLIVWADKQDRALTCRKIVGERAIALQSPKGLDANDLLKQGQLRGFVEHFL